MREETSLNFIALFAIYCNDIRNDNISPYIHTL